MLPDAGVPSSYVQGQVSGQQRHPGPISCTAADSTSGRSRRNRKRHGRRRNPYPSDAPSHQAPTAPSDTRDRGPISCTAADSTSGRSRRNQKGQGRRRNPYPSDAPSHQAPTAPSDTRDRCPISCTVADSTSGRSRRNRKGHGRRRNPYPSDAPSHQAPTAPSDTRDRCPISCTAADSTSGRRRRNRNGHGRRRNPYPSDAPSHQAPTAPSDTRVAFELRYEEGALLGQGSNGSVFAGYRCHDQLPVAIKHIRRDKAEDIPMCVINNDRMVPLEVGLMLRLNPAFGATSAVVSLLDWYDLGDELILVLERPVPCMDMVSYINARGCGLGESEAKGITKQLVDGLSEIHSKGVFHTDIKPDNILCETIPDGPRIKIIDLGSGTVVKEGVYTTPQGTDIYTSPEWFQFGCYRAEPATVWQLGLVLYALLFVEEPFDSIAGIVHESVDISRDLSLDCRDLLLSCLRKNPADRPSLETLKRHPWLR